MAETPLNEFWDSAPTVVQDESGPAHQQVVDWLRSGIAGRQLAPGARFPPERQLASLLGVSRMTLRQALATLESRGDLLRRRGADGGTYVRAGRPEIDLTNLVGLAAQLEGAELAPGARVRSAITATATATVAEQLRLEAGAPVYEIVRVRLANGVPLCIEHSFFPVNLVPDMLQSSLGGSLYQILAAHGHEPSHAVEYLRGTLVSEPDAELLGVEPGMAGILMERTAYDANEIAVEYSEDIYRSDRVRLKIQSRL